MRPRFPRACAASTSRERSAPMTSAPNVRAAGETARPRRSSPTDTRNDTASAVRVSASSSRGSARNSLDVGERAFAQPRDVAARVHELVAAREHVLPRACPGCGTVPIGRPAARMRDFGMRDEPRDFGMLEIAHLADGRRQIERTDEHEVDAFDGEDRVDVLDAPSPTRSGRRSAGCRRRSPRSRSPCRSSTRAPSSMPCRGGRAADTGMRPLPRGPRRRCRCSGSAPPLRRRRARA